MEICRVFEYNLLDENLHTTNEEGFESFIYCDHFVRLPAETLLALLRSDERAVSSEAQIVGAIARWICPRNDVDCERLRFHAPEMLKEVQWHEITLEFRKRLLQNYPLFRNKLGCAPFLHSLAQWIGAADKDRTDCPFNEQKRII